MKHLLFAMPLLVALVTDRAYGAAEAFSSERYRTSDSHSQVILAPRDADKATLYVGFHAGELDGEAADLTRISQLALIAGEPAFRKQLYRDGAELSLETGIRSSAFVLTSPAVSFEGHAKKLLRILSRTRVTEQSLELAKRGHRARGFDYRPDALAVALGRAVIPEHKRRSRQDDGRLRIDEMTVAEVRTHREQYFVPANSIVVVAGAFDAERVRGLLGRWKGGAPTTTTPNIQTPTGTFHLPSLRNAQLAAFPFDGDTPGAFAAARVAARIVEVAAADDHNCRGIEASFVGAAVGRPWMSFVLFSVTAETPVTRPQGFLARLLTEKLEGLSAGGLTSSQFEGAKSEVWQTIVATDRAPRRLARALAVDHDVPGWYGPEAAAALERLSLPKLTRFFQRQLLPARAIHARLFGASSVGGGG